MLTLIVAASENNAIGMHNKLLWNLPADTKFFKNSTWALPVIMGRKSYDSLGKPLMGRYNIVITNRKDWHPEGVKVVPNLAEAIEAARLMETNEVMIAGGGHVYRDALPIADRVLLTRVHAVLDGDTFFPELNPAEWKLAASHPFYKDEKHAYDFTFETWDRIKNNGSE